MSIDKVIDDTRTAMFSAKQAAQDKREWASYWDGVEYAYQSMLTPLEELKAELEALKDTSYGHVPVTPPLADIERKEPGTCSHHFGPGTRIGEMVCHNCGFTKQDVFLFREENCPFHAVVNPDGSKGRCMNCGKYV